jgi:hypothetical protein
MSLSPPVWGVERAIVQANYLSFGHEGSQPFSQHRLAESRQAALLTICAASWNFGLAAKVEV